MPSFKEMQNTKWDKEYRQRGSIWRKESELGFIVPSRARVLELGCGNGKTLRALLKEDCLLTAIDISPTAVEMCRRIAEKTKRKAGIFVADACALPFKNESFDLIVCFHVLEHLLMEDRRRAVEEMRRVLAKGGILVFKAFSVNDMRFGKGKEVEKNTFLRGNKLIYHYFEEGELGEMFRGFKIIEKSIEKRDVIYNGRKYLRENCFLKMEKS